MYSRDVLDRALAATKLLIKYKLGAGGMDPKNTTPANINKECDCSGFVCWCLGMSRKTDHPLYMALNGGWINTDAMCYDIGGQGGFFEFSAPVVGGIIVYPRRSKGTVGHVGIISEVRLSGDLRVIHCSSGNYRKYGQAVHETDALVFRGKMTRTGVLAGLKLDVVSR